MANSPIPQARCESIFALDPTALHARGIRLLLLDLDNTLIPYGQKLPDERLHTWISTLRTAGIEPFVLSNSRKPTRVQTFSEALGVSHLRRAGKPRRAGFHAALARMERSREQSAMVGDQIFTDILGANRAGIFSILVQPLRQDTIFRRLRFWIETPFRRAARERM